MQSLISTVFSVSLLLAFHISNYQLCCKFIRPLLLPILFTTNKTRLTNSINNGLNELGEIYKIPNDSIRLMSLSNDDSINNNNNFNKNYYLNIIFDLLISFSLQLIKLFLIDILKIGDFNIIHFDWYITLSVLIISLGYIIPSFLLYFWIFQINDINRNHSNGKYIFKFGLCLIIWSIITYSAYIVTIREEINGNFMQISLYLLSLFGMGCLSILNSMGCVIGCYEIWKFYKGYEIIEINRKDIKLSKELKILSNLINNDTLIDDKIIWDKLLLIDSLIRDLNYNKFNNKNRIVKFIRFSTWLYCIYKVIYAIIKFIQLILITLISLTKLIDEKNITNNYNNDIYYDGSGDFLSITIAKVLFIIFNKNLNNLSYDELLKNNFESIDKISMIVNLILTILFFSFSFQNVLLTFKNLKLLGNKILILSDHEIIKKFVNREEMSLDNNINILDNINKSIYEIICLFVCEITGLYVVSTGLLLNSSNMPIHVKKLIMNEEFWINEKLNINGKLLDVEFINNWFDKWFAIGSIWTFLILLIINYNDMFGDIFIFQNNIDEEFV